jgi:TATA-box binding protein (TBP) (component of TFIID and TFIIIB)
MLVNKGDNIEDGSIVYAQYKKNYKGTLFKKITEKYFLNSVTIIMKINTKFINVKVSNKGKLQITGCNENVPVKSILQKFWNILQGIDEEKIWNFINENDTEFRAMVIPVMCNINFSINFQINRELLHLIINTQTNHTSILEPSDGYVGVNIKIEAKDEPLEEMSIDEFILRNDYWVNNKKKFMEYISTLTAKEQKKKMAKCYVNTFLVFYSGKVIMSGGLSYINRKKAYDMFMDIITKHRENIIA